MSGNNGGGKKSPWLAVEIVVMCIFAVLIISMLVIYFSFRETGAVPKFFGYYIYQTHAVNMEPKVPEGAAVFASEKEKENISSGSVILCMLDGAPTIINAVETLEEESGKFYIVRFNTSPQNETYKIPAESVIAKAVYYDTFTGSLLSFATSEKGIILVVIIPSILIVLFQVIKIVLAQKNEYDDYEAEEEDDTPNLYANIGKDGFDEEESYRSLPPVRAKFDTAVKEKPESVIRIDSSGAAVYEPAEKKQEEDILITSKSLDRMSGHTPENSDMTVYNARSYVNEAVKIKEEPKRPDPISDILSPELAEKSHSAFRATDVIPETIASVKTAARPETEPIPVRSRRFSPQKAAEEPQAGVPKQYFSLDEKAPSIPLGDADKPILNTNAIPENSVVPKERIAPKRKASSGKTVEELMSIIDSQQAKIKRK